MTDKTRRTDVPRVIPGVSKVDQHEELDDGEDHRADDADPSVHSQERWGQEQEACIARVHVFECVHDSEREREKREKRARMCVHVRAFILTDNQRSPDEELGTPPPVVQAAAGRVGIWPRPKSTAATLANARSKTDTRHTHAHSKTDN
jgi:hypothetical protein